MEQENLPTLQPQSQMTVSQTILNTHPFYPTVSDRDGTESALNALSLHDRHIKSPTAPTATDNELEATRKSLKVNNKRDSENQQHTDDTHSVSTSSSPSTQFAAVQPVSPIFLTDIPRSSMSSHLERHSYRSPSSPGRVIHSPSPYSPTFSQIFERNVQEDIVSAQVSPSIPSHIMTDNHIPSILEASSAAITDDRLDPDSVKIITHSIHQPVILTVAVTGAVDQSTASSVKEDIHFHSLEHEDSVINYGASDTTDVRRLSFISFADVVHAEHVENDERLNSRDSFQNIILSSNSTVPISHNRSSSPLRSPVSSHELSTSTPMSLSPSFKRFEPSPDRGRYRTGSPLPPLFSSAPTGGLHGEFNVETMQQALSRTNSGDLSAMRSVPSSLIEFDDEIQ